MHQADEVTGAGPDFFKFFLYLFIFFFSIFLFLFFFFWGGGGSYLTRYGVQYVASDLLGRAVWRRL